LIECKGIGIDFEDKEALKDLSFEIQDNEHLVLLGCNGSGKSTLLRVLAGLYFTKTGSYRYNQNIIDKQNMKVFGRTFRQEVGILFQNPDTMLFNPTVYDEIAFGLHEMQSNEIDQRVRQVAKECQIEHLLDRSPLKLSGGEKQKTALAVILAPRPKMLLLDEPTANLDPKSTGWLVDLLYDLEVTLVVSTHNLSMASEFASRALVLGPSHQLLYDGDLPSLWKEKELLDTANLIHRHRHNSTKEDGFHVHNWE
jgi:cobalt/nickel transport system ATP-binding protein